MNRNTEPLLLADVEERLQSAMPSPYDDYLAAFHAKHQIADDILNEALRGVSHQDVTSKRRIVAGEANEVYDIGFADGESVIVRIARNSDKAFDREQWAIAACEQRGIPVPEVLSVTRFSTPEQPVDVCIQRRLPGVVLLDASLEQDELREIVAQAGDYLSRMHDIPTSGFGYLDAHGQGLFNTNADQINGFADMEPEFRALALRVGLDPGDVSRAMALIIDDAAVAVQASPCLVHNDYEPKHIMVEHGKITGIIDFGEVAGDEPLTDFVRWAFYHADRFPLAWLMEGYGNKAVFGGSFAARLDLQTIALSLWAMRWYDSRGYTEGVNYARMKFQADLATLN